MVKEQMADSRPSFQTHITNIHRQTHKNISQTIFIASFASSFNHSFIRNFDARYRPHSSNIKIVSVQFSRVSKFQPKLAQALSFCISFIFDSQRASSVENSLSLHMVYEDLCASNRVCLHVYFCLCACTGTPPKYVYPYLSLYYLQGSFFNLHSIFLTHVMQTMAILFTERETRKIK